MTEFQNYAPPPAPPPQLIKRIGMKTVGYGQPPYYQPPNPDHFSPWHGTTLGPSTNPNSSTVANLPSGISLTNIALNGGYLTFDVDYSQGSQPNYSIFIGPTDVTVPSSWSGNVYCQRSSNAVPINVSSIAPGTVADVFCKIQSSALSALGTLSQPITIRGIGNGSYRYQWTGLDLIPSSSTVFPQLQYCNVRNATVGMLLQPLSSTMPFVRNCMLTQNDIDLRIHSANPNVRAELAGLDLNNMSTLQISGYAKLENGNFALSPATVIHLGQVNNPANIVVAGNRTLRVTTPLAFDFNATIGGSIWQFDVDLTVPQGKGLTLQSGSTLLFGETNRLISYGPLAAIGTSEQPITFANQPSLSHWLGIHVESGLSVSELRHCEITNAITGVAVNSSRFKLKESLISDCSVGIDISGYHPKLYYQIDTNTVQNCWTSGIVINNAYNITLHDNTISGCTAGLVTTHSTVRLYRNVIENSSEEGVFAGEYSNPRFGDVLLADPGNNVIRSSGIAQLHAVNSTPFLGIGCERVYGGWNSVYGDALLVHAEKGAYVTANWNWWGFDPPKKEQFLAQDATIDYDCWMPYDPNEGMRPSSSLPLISGNKGGDDPPPILSISPEGVKLRQALALRAQGDYRRALVVYASLIRTSPNAPEARVALSEARNTFYDFIHASNDTTLQSVLEDSLRAYRNVHPNAFVRRLAKALLATEIVNRRDFVSAVAEYQQLLQSATTNLDRTICLFALFNINAQGTRDRSEAERYLAQLQTLSPGDIRTRIASARFASLNEAEGGNGMQRPSVVAGIKSIATLPTDFALHQNYPNPFNPSTTIKYTLPIDAHVALRLYDVLGREVLTMIDEQAKSGYHSVLLDASRLSSGVYFYRMQAGAFAQTKKLLLLR